MFEKRKMERNFILNKRAISPLVATVLLIVIVVSIAAVIYVWQAGFIAEQISKFNQPAETNCEQLRFAWSFQNTTKDPYEGDLSINNQGNIPISQVNVRVISKEGKIITRNYNVSIMPTQTIVHHLWTANFSNKIVSGAEMDVVPIIAGKGVKTGGTKLFICETQARRETIQ